MVRRAAGRVRWAGPPPLLVLATLLGFVVAPLVDQGSSAVAQQPAGIAALSPRYVEPRIVHPARPTTDDSAARAGEAGSTADTLRLAPLEVGVASFNMFRQLTADQARADALSLTSRPGVDVVGWQEAETFGSVLHSLPDWTTKTFRYGDGNAELAVSWRSDEFRLVSARLRRVALGVSSTEGRYPFGNRLVAVVTLARRGTDQLLTVVNTHLPQKAEDPDRPGEWLDTINATRARAQIARLVDMWQHASGRWVVGTGDYNIDAGADARYRLRGGPLAELGKTAVSTYQRLGSDLGPTHPPTGRNIDYVWLDRSALRQGRIALNGQRVPGGFNSDHDPLIAWLTLT